MADILVDGATKVAFVTTIANIATPTLAELNAGVELQEYLRSDGLEGFEPTTAEVDNTSLASTFDTKVPGRTSFSGTGLVLKKQDGADTAFEALNTKGTSGYLVIRDGEDESVAWTAADVVSVYPCFTGQWAYLPREANSMLRYRVPLPISGEPNQTAVVAAS